MQFQTIPASMLQLVNQLFDLEKKVEIMSNNKSLQRNIRRMKMALEDMNIVYINPLGEKYDETRTDCEATISGTSTKKLRITEVIKPIIAQKEGEMLMIIQKGVVIVEGR